MCERAVSNIAKRLKSVSRRIARIAGFEIWMGVLFPTEEDRNAPVKIYRKGDDISLYVNYPAFVSLELPVDKEMRNANWMDRRVTFTAVTLETFADALEEMLEKFNRDDIFYLMDGKLCMYPQKEDHIVQVKIKDHYIRLAPTIVDDFEGNVYEGVEICINRKANFGRMTFRELKALWKIFCKIDLYEYSQLLLNFIGPKTIFRTQEEEEDLDKTKFLLDSKLNSIEKLELAEGGKKCQKS